MKKKRIKRMIVAYIKKKLGILSPTYTGYKYEFDYLLYLWRVERYTKKVGRYRKKVNCD
jgi:hypothetical protein